MADSTTSSIDIPAPAEQVLAVIADLEAYPQWAGGIREVQVLTTIGDLPKTARFTVDSGPIKDSYTLEYTFDTDEDGLGTVSWHLIEGGITKQLDGSYVIGSATAGSVVTYNLAVDISLPLPGLIKRKAEKTIVETALADLRARVLA